MYQSAKLTSLQAVYHRHCSRIDLQIIKNDVFKKYYKSRIVRLVFLFICLILFILDKNSKELNLQDSIK